MIVSGVLKELNRTSGHADFLKPGQNYASLSDKSKQLRLIHVIYENDGIVAGNVWVSTINP